MDALEYIQTRTGKGCNSIIRNCRFQNSKGLYVNKLLLLHLSAAEESRPVELFQEFKGLVDQLGLKGMRQLFRNKNILLRDKVDRFKNLKKSFFLEISFFIYLNLNDVSV